MRHGRGVGGRASRLLRGAERLSRCSVRRKGGSPGLSHRDLTARPSARLFDRSARTVVTGLRVLEEVQYVLRAIGRPHCKKAMMGIL